MGVANQPMTQSGISIAAAAHGIVLAPEEAYAYECGLFPVPRGFTPPK